MENGKRLEQQFNELGFRVVCVDEIKSPQVITYYFNCLNIADFSKARVERLLEKISAYNHIKFGYVETTKSHFATTHAIAQRQPLFLSSFQFKPNYDKIVLPIGKDLNNNVVELDLDKIPHILIAGTTGSGKSVLINTLISSLYITTPKELFDLILIDPKKVELGRFKVLPNVRFIDETNEAVAVLSELVDEMEMRYNIMEEKGVKNGKGLFKTKIVVIDELADLMLSSRYEVEESIVRLAQKSRACNIHLIVATQRPTINIVSGLIKANLPCKICLKVASVRDSVVVLDKGGAEKLLGFGDCLIKLPYQVEETRCQVAYISDERIDDVIKTRG